MIVIFDLDGTVIDSQHRQHHNAKGVLDIDHWIRHSTWREIMRDGLMPLAETWRGLLVAGHTIVTCTSRVMAAADHAYMNKHGLFSHFTFSREPGEMESAPILKTRWLRELQETVNCENAVFYDDEIGNRQAAERIGISSIDPAVL